ncbi:MAG: Mur ligase domain-containing protein [Planctomycetota bacterium]
MTASLVSTSVTLALNPPPLDMPIRRPIPLPSALPTPAGVERVEVAGRAVYFIGIGGCGMSGLARMLRTRGAQVSGSDSSPQESTAALMGEGIEIGFDQTRGWLPDVCDLVVYSAAVKPEHPQLVEARRRGVATMAYAQALGRSMLGSTGIAIAGTHGKSSTTAMLGTALTDAGIDPTVIVGATSRQLLKGSIGTASKRSGLVEEGTGFRLGAAKVATGPMAGRPGVLVAEACEFNRSFHHFYPTIASISSVEADHLDMYKSIDEIIESFRHFASLLPPENLGGRLLIAHEGAHRKEVTAGLKCLVETIGFTPAADWVIAFDTPARRVTLSHDRGEVASWTMRIPGEHMAFNAAVAVALGTMVGADAKVLAASLCEFRGIDRRMQFLGERQVAGGAVRVYDDYGHHPTEIDVTLRALRGYERPEDKGGRLVCVFQPHQHSRTRHLMEEFAQSFSSADIVIVPDIYFVRDSEEERQKVTAQDLVDRLTARGVNAMQLSPFSAIVEKLQELCVAGDLVVTMGAGPVFEVARGYLAGGIRRG